MQGPTGSKGWTPIIANVPDGTRIVQKVIDWTGGQGIKPAINQFITGTGFSTDISLAVDIRGYGESGDNVTLISQTIVAKNHCAYLIPTSMGADSNISFPVISPTQGFEIDVITLFDNLCIVNFPAGYTGYRPSSRSIGSIFENINFVEIPASSYFLPKGKFKIRAFGSISSIYIF